MEANAKQEGGQSQQDIENIFIPYMLVIIILLQIYLIITSYLQKKDIKRIHQTEIIIFICVIIAAFRYQFFAVPYILGQTYKLQFVKLPPVILNSGFKLKRANFFSNLPFILTFGILGTILTFVFIGIFCSYLTELGTQDSFLIASVLAASDTIIGMAKLNEGAWPNVCLIFLGEGNINNAVVYMLFQAVFKRETGIGFVQFWEVMYEITWKGISGIIIGTFFGFLVTFILKKSHDQDYFHKNVNDILLMLFFAGLSYHIGEIFDYSEIICLLICAIIMAQYAYYNLSKKSQEGSTLLFKSLGTIAEGLVFVNLGLNSFKYFINGINGWLVLFIICTAFLSRTISIYICHLILKQFFISDSLLRRNTN